MANVSITLFAKGKDDLEAAELLLPIANQHDNAGAHLCKAAEKLAKAYLKLAGIQNYPTSGKHGHDLGLIFQMLEKTDFPVEKFIELLRLQIYDSRVGHRYIDEEARVDLQAQLQLLKSLKQLLLQKITAKKKR